MTTPPTTGPSQVPASWQYSLVNGVSTATYNGAVVAAGSIAFTNLTITGTLTVDGATVLDGAVTVNNNFSVTTPGGNIFDVTDGGVIVNTSATNTAITINSGTNTTTIEGGTVVVDGTTNVTIETGPGGNINLTPGAGGNVVLPGGNLTIIQPVVNPSITVVSMATGAGPGVGLGDALAHGATLDGPSVHTANTNIGSAPGLHTLAQSVTTAAANEVLVVAVHVGSWSIGGAQLGPVVTVTAPGLTFTQRGHGSNPNGAGNNTLDVYTFWAPVPVAGTYNVTVGATFNAQQSEASLALTTQAFSGISLTTPWDSIAVPSSNIVPASGSFSIASNSNAVLFFASCGQNVLVPTTSPNAWTTIANGGNGIGNAFSNSNTSFNASPTAPGNATGYINLGGLILQWGTIPSTASGATATVIFPIPFPTACMNVVLCDDSGPSNNALGTFDVAHGSITRSQFQAYLNDFTTSPTPNMTGFWQAIGN